MNFSMAAVSPYLYVATACFVVSSFTSDLLLIRLMLTVAYGFLVLASASGSSPDGSFDNSPLREGVIDVTMLINICLLALHLFVSTRLVLDDHTPKQLPDDKDAEALYNYFRARCGMTQLEFWAIYEQGGWVDLDQGEEVPHCGHRLYLVVDGKVTCKSCFTDGHWTKPFRKRSGEFFDLRLFNVFTLPIGFDNSRFAATSDVPSRLFYWDAEGLRKMAKRGSPQLLQFWEFVVIRTLAAEAVKHHLKRSETLYDSLFQPEDPEWLNGARSHDFSFKISAESQSHVERVLRWLWSALMLVPPRGVRHQAGLLIENPFSGKVNVSSHGGDEGAAREIGQQHRDNDGGIDSIDSSTLFDDKGMENSGDYSEEGVSSGNMAEMVRLGGGLRRESESTSGKLSKSEDRV